MHWSRVYLSYFALSLVSSFFPTFFLNLGFWPTPYVRTQVIIFLKSLKKNTQVDSRRKVCDPTISVLNWKEVISGTPNVLGNYWKRRDRSLYSLRQTVLLALLLCLLMRRLMRWKGFFRWNWGDHRTSGLRLFSVGEQRKCLRTLSNCSIRTPDTVTW